MSTQIQTVKPQQDTSIIEQVMIQGDLAKLQPSERVQYYKSVCESLNLNPFTKPFEYINLNGKLTLYAKRDATDQLRSNNNISVTITAREKMDDIYVVTAKGATPDGRCDESIGAVNIKGLSGDALANALMKAETKAKRRVTLSICGLGFTDETEIETIPTAKITQVDDKTGEILTQPQLSVPASPQDAKTAQSDKPLMTDAQNKKVYVMLSKKFGNDGENTKTAFKSWCFNNLLPESTKHWTKTDASKAIPLLEDMPDFTIPDVPEDYDPDYDADENAHND